MLIFPSGDSHSLTHSWLGNDSGLARISEFQTSTAKSARKPVRVVLLTQFCLLHNYLSIGMGSVAVLYLVVGLAC